MRARDFYQYEQFGALINKDNPKASSLISIDKIVKNVLSDFIESRELWEIENFKIQEIECQRMDGFIPNGYNHGGYRAIGFLFGHGQGFSFTSNPDAVAHIEQGQEYDREFIARELADKHPEFKIDVDKFGYSDAEKLGLASEYEYLESSDTEVTYMVEFVVMYNGFSDGAHNFTVQSAFNWEYPYHRRGSLPAWAGGGATEVYGEVEIECMDLRKLRGQLSKALKKCLKAIV